MKQILVGGPLLGSRQRNIASDFAAWDQFEPLITPEIKFEKRESQRFVLLPHSRHISVLAYRTGVKIATLIPTFDGEKGDNEVIIETVCLAKYRRKKSETTAQDVLDTMETDEEIDQRAAIDRIVDEVVVMAGCRDGTIREFSLAVLENQGDTKSVKCGDHWVLGPCYRPRRVIRVSRQDPIMQITVPPLRTFIQEEGILCYMTSRTKDLDEEGPRKSRNEKSDAMNVAVLRVLIPHFDGTSDVSLLRKEQVDIQRKWQLDKFKCRVGKDKVGGFMNTTPFRLTSVAKPIANDMAIFLVMGRASVVHVYYDRAKVHQRASPMAFPMPPDNPVSAIHVSVNNSDIACGHYFGEITVMNDVLSQVEKYHHAVSKAEQQYGDLAKSSIGKPEDPRSKVITSKVHWHAHPVASLVYDAMSSPIDPILYSGGEESVLVSWQVSQGRSTPSHVLPRIALGGIVHVVCADKVDDSPSNGILLFCEDNSLQLFESHNKGRLWKLQGLACKPKEGKLHTHQRTTIEVDPRARSSKDAQIVITGLPEAPGHMHWYDPVRSSLSASLEVAPFNRVSKTEAEDAPMPAPAITKHVFSSGGNELITLEEAPTENIFIGAYDNQGRNGAYGVVSTIRFWAWNDSPAAAKGSFSKVPYTMTAAMTYPHGPKNRVSALATTRDGTMACTVSNDEKAFRIWQKVAPDEGDETRRLPAWTCRYKVAIPAGFSNFCTRPGGVAFSDDGSILAVAFGNMVTLWDSEEARFLNSIRHLEGAQGSIDSVKFVSPGRLRDILLVKSHAGVSLQSPFGSRSGFKGWSWGIPLGANKVTVSDAEMVDSHGCVAITSFNRSTGRSRLVLINAATGRFGVNNDESTAAVLQDIEGRIVSMSAAGKPTTPSNWCNASAEAGSSMLLYSLTSLGELTKFCTEENESIISTSAWENATEARAPTIDVASGNSSKRRRHSANYVVSHLEPNTKKSAIEIFGDASGESHGKEAQPSTSELPSLSQNFVRAFVGRRLLRTKTDEGAMAE